MEFEMVHFYASYSSVEKHTLAKTWFEMVHKSKPSHTSNNENKFSTLFSHFLFSTTMAMLNVLNVLLIVVYQLPRHGK